MLGEKRSAVSHGDHHQVCSLQLRTTQLPGNRERCLHWCCERRVITTRTSSFSPCVNQIMCMHAAMQWCGAVVVKVPKAGRPQHDDGLRLLLPPPVYVCHFQGMASSRETLAWWMQRGEDTLGMICISSYGSPQPGAVVCLETFFFVSMTTAGS